mmetsp:Transcript_26061/g.46266  ORF Transcript_26061/g.46266 Transcript_26061/m.46266 type:complete len:161 (+) Transcript_26061:922-1404(+)
MSDLSALNLGSLTSEYDKVKQSLLVETRKLKEKLQQLETFNEEKKAEWENRLQSKAVEVAALKIQKSERIACLHKQVFEARQLLQNLKEKISAAEARKVKVLEPQLKQHISQRAKIEQDILRLASDHNGALLELYGKLEGAQKDLVELSEQVYLEESQQC